MSPNLSLLTSASAVTEAIAECDTLGREKFLQKYGCKRSRLYSVVVGGRAYDAKAIASVAYRKQHDALLKPSEFSGGLVTIAPVFERLGFLIRETRHPAMDLTVGSIYWRKELLDIYGGQLQRGIWTPTEFPVVFLFSGESGKPFGYKDGWKGGFFEYTGEGQKGGMTFSAGNKAVRDHRENGKDLLLFIDLGKGKGVRFDGLFECTSCGEVGGVDKDRKQRTIIVFSLARVDTAALTDKRLDDLESIPSGERSEPIEVLRTRAYAAADPSAPTLRTGDAKRTWYERSERVRAYVLARANGFCEARGQEAPFRRGDGSPYLEPHHTTRLADEGLDHPSTVGAICPTCHRRIHSGGDGKQLNSRLKRRLKEKEGAVKQTDT
jgi:5-methylcytosine-specific restriction protein A